MKLLKQLITFIFLWGLLIQVGSVQAEVKDGNIKIVPFTKVSANFPCSRCHQHVDPVAVDPNNLKSTHKDMAFDHMENIKSCFLCHSKEERDKLKLLDGNSITFDESYKLCWQCHGEKKADWQKGIHGKQIGQWNGEKSRFSCVECHEAHKPKFPQMKADAPPPMHKFGIKK